MVEKRKWSPISIPTSLHEQVRALVEREDSGYTSLSSFFAEAIRLHLNEIRKTRALPPFRIDRTTDQEDHSLDH